MYTLARPSGPLLWTHGASVGEALSILSLLERTLAARPDWSAVLTTGTVSAARALRGRLPARAVHQYVPVDRIEWARSFLDHWRPDAALWIESEFWPNLLSESRNRQLPMLLVNGRVSQTSAHYWSLAPRWIEKILSVFRATLAWGEDDAKRLRALGARNVSFIGNVKYAAAPLPADPCALEACTTMIGTRPTWLAASTHAGEEALAGRVHRTLKVKHPNLLTLIAPRHPERTEEIVSQLRALGLSIACRSARETISASTDVYLINTLGELGIFYRLVPLVLIGNSLTGRGGHNPLEPARLGAVVVCGPHMNAFRDIVDRLHAGGGLVKVANDDALIARLNALLDDGCARHTLAEAGRMIVASEAMVLERVLAKVLALMDTAELGGML